MTKIKIIPPQVCPEAHFRGESRFCQVDTINRDSEGKGGGQEDASLLVCLAARHTVAPWCKDGKDGIASLLRASVHIPASHFPYPLSKTRTHRPQVLVVEHDEIRRYTGTRQT